MRGFRELVVWQRSMDLVEDVYRVAEELPLREKFGLGSQICRAAISIPSNIAEGHGRGGKNEFRRFLRIAVGSLRELETQLLIVERLKLSSPERLESALKKADETGRMLNALLRSTALH